MEFGGAMSNDRFDFREQWEDSPQIIRSAPALTVRPSQALAIPRRQLNPVKRSTQPMHQVRVRIQIQTRSITTISIMFTLDLDDSYSLIDRLLEINDSLRLKLNLIILDEAQFL